MRKLALIAASAILTLGTAIVIPAAPASARVMQAGPSEQAPECVHVVVLAPQVNGTAQRVHFAWCGSGPADTPSGDSAIRDSQNHHYFVLDGSRQIGGDCGSWSDPCYIFPR